MFIPISAKEELDEEEWIFLLTGGVALDNPYANPDSSWLSEKSWSEVTRASLLPSLKDLRQSFERNIDAWKKFYDLTNPHESQLPEPYDRESADSLNKLVVLRCVRPDKLVPAIRNFVIERMGQTYVEPPPFELQDSYKDSDNVTPLIFILSPG